MSAGSLGTQDDSFQLWIRFLLPSDAELLHANELLALPVQYQNCIADYRSFFGKLLSKNPYKERIHFYLQAPVATDGGIVQVGVLDKKAKESLLIRHGDDRLTIGREVMKSLFGNKPELRELSKVWLVSGEIKELFTQWMSQSHQPPSSDLQPAVQSQATAEHRMEPSSGNRLGAISLQASEEGLAPLPKRYSVVAELGSGLSQEQAEFTARKMRLSEIEKVMRDMTGCDPLPKNISIRVYNNENYHEETAHVVFKLIMRPSYCPDLERMRYIPAAFDGTLHLGINAKAVECCYPEEMRGVLIHELGHLYTQGLLATNQGQAYPYTEGFADLFRSAAAIREGADWEQAIGCNGFEVLHGPAEPQLIPGHSGLPGTNLVVVSKALVCNRIIHLLGGLNEAKLAAIARACALQRIPADCVPFTDVLENIERSTGVRGFSQSFLNDPMLRFGNIRTDEITATAIPNLRGNAYTINCFKITDPLPLFMHTRKRTNNPETIAPPLDQQHVHLETIGEECPEYTVTLLHENGSSSMSLTTSSSMIISPRTIINDAQRSGCDWPTGSVAIEFQLGNNTPVRLKRQIVISPEQRECILERAKRGMI